MSSLAAEAAAALEPEDAMESLEWPDELNEPGYPDPKPFPNDALPGSVRAHVTSVAGNLQVPIDLTASLALGVSSAALAGHVEVLVRDNWREPVGLYLAPILPPAARKSPAHAIMTAPLRAYEDRAVADAASRVLAAQDVLDVAEKSLELVKKDLLRGKATPDDVEAARNELEDARARIPPDGRLLAGDITPEAMVMRMAAQGGRLAIIEPEPGPLQLVAGRYSDTARLDELKKAWSGEAVLQDRVGRPPIRVPRPALTLSLCMQPGVLEALQNGKAFRIEGVLGRFLWSRPPHGLGSRLTGPDVPPLDREAEQVFVGIVGALAGLRPAGEREDGSPMPHLLRLDTAALDVLYSFEAELEPQLADGARLAGIRDWAGKAVGQAVRVAAHLEIMARAGDRRPLIGDPIGGWAMESAIRIMRMYTSHALVVLGQLGIDKRTELLRYVLDRIKQLPEDSTVRDVWQACRGRAAIESMDDLHPLLDSLVERGCIRIVAKPQDGPGRPPSPTVEVHPTLRAPTSSGHTHNPRNSDIGAGSGDCGDIRRGSGLDDEHDVASIIGPPPEPVEVDS